MTSNDLTPDQLRALADAIETRDRRECTDEGSSWCPIHGNCTCAPDAYSEYDAGDDLFCPLHGDRSAHAPQPLTVTIRRHWFSGLSHTYPNNRSKRA